MTTDLIAAVNFALADEWERSHLIVQDLDGTMAAWIHAVLHKIEGDESNSRYWYARARKRFEDFVDVNVELAFIKKALENTLTG